MDNDHVASKRRKRGPSTRGGSQDVCGVASSTELVVYKPMGATLSSGDAVMALISAMGPSEREEVCRAIYNRTEITTTRASICLPATLDEARVSSMAVSAIRADYARVKGGFSNEDRISKHGIILMLARNMSISADKVKDICSILDDKNASRDVTRRTRESVTRALTRYENGRDAPIYGIRMSLSIDVQQQVCMIHYIG